MLTDHWAAQLSIHCAHWSLDCAVHTDHYTTAQWRLITLHCLFPSGPSRSWPCPWECSRHSEQKHLEMFAVWYYTMWSCMGWCSLVFDGVVLCLMFVVWSWICMMFVAFVDFFYINKCSWSGMKWFFCVFSWSGMKWCVTVLDVRILTYVWNLEEIWK